MIEENLMLNGMTALRRTAMAALAATAAISSARAETGNISRTKTTQTDVYGIDPAGLSIADGCYRSMVHLPQGALMTHLVLNYAVESGLQITATLNRTAYSNAVTQLVATVKGNKGEATYQQASANIPPALGRINNKSFAYTFVTCPQVGTAFRRARITYTYE
jgi:hypothetical protein